MRADIRFQGKLRDYDLADPARRRSFSRQVFTAVAPRYALITRLLSLGRDRRWKDLLIRELPAGATRVLDLACGTGDLTGLLAARYPAARVYGLDLNPQMLRRARRRLTGSAFQFRAGDMSRLDWPDGTFEVVTGGYALRYPPSLATLLEEVHRVLKPGGRAAFLDFSKPASPLLQPLQLALLRAWGGVWGWVFHRNPDVYGMIAESLRPYPDRGRLERMFLKAGFRSVRTRLFLGGFTALVTATR